VTLVGNDPQPMDLEFEPDGLLQPLGIVAPAVIKRSGWGTVNISHASPLTVKAIEQQGRSRSGRATIPRVFGAVTGLVASQSGSDGPCAWVLTSGGWALLLEVSTGGLVVIGRCKFFTGICDGGRHSLGGIVLAQEIVLGGRDCLAVCGTRAGVAGISPRSPPERVRLFDCKSGRMLREFGPRGPSARLSQPQPLPLARDDSAPPAASSASSSAASATTEEATSEDTLRDIGAGVVFKSCLLAGNKQCLVVVRAHRSAAEMAYRPTSLSQTDTPAPAAFCVVASHHQTLRIWRCASVHACPLERLQAIANRRPVSGTPQQRHKTSSSSSSSSSASAGAAVAAGDDAAPAVSGLQLAIRAASVQLLQRLRAAQPQPIRQSVSEVSHSCLDVDGGSKDPADNDDDAEEDEDVIAESLETEAESMQSVTACLPVKRGRASEAAAVRSARTDSHASESAFVLALTLAAPDGSAAVGEDSASWRALGAVAMRQRTRLGAGREALTARRQAARGAAVRAAELLALARQAAGGSAGVIKASFLGTALSTAGTAATGHPHAAPGGPAAVVGRWESGSRATRSQRIVGVRVIGDGSGGGRAVSMQAWNVMGRALVGDGTMPSAAVLSPVLGEAARRHDEARSPSDAWLMRMGKAAASSSPTLPRTPVLPVRGELSLTTPRDTSTSDAVWDEADAAQVAATALATLPSKEARATCRSANGRTWLVLEAASAARAAEAVADMAAVLPEPLKLRLGRPPSPPGTAPLAVAAALASAEASLSACQLGRAHRELAAVLGASPAELFAICKQVEQLPMARARSSSSAASRSDSAGASGGGTATIAAALERRLREAGQAGAAVLVHDCADQHSLAAAVLELKASGGSAIAQRQADVAARRAVGCLLQELVR
jgi:hypothetical protein